MSDTNDEAEPLADVTETDNDEEGDETLEGEPLEGEEEEDDEEEEEEEEEEEDDDEDDESSDSENEDPARERSTESKPNSRTTPTASSITINGAESSTQVPVTKPESPPAVAPTSPLSSPPPSVPGSSILQQAIAQAAAAAAVPLDASQVSSTGTVKPKSKATKPRKHRTPSPSPPPVAPPPPLRTVRLEITLGGPSNYEVDVRNLSKETGQRDATPPPPAPPPESEDEEAAKAVKTEEEVPEGGAAKKKKRKKKSVAQEYYDTNDPFIDDSELAVDQRTYFAQTKQTGFYVSSGEVALLKDVKSPKKPKSRKSLVPGAGSASVAGGGGDGTRDSPIALVDEEEGGAGSLHNAISKGIKGVGLVSSSGVIGGHKADGAKDGAGTSNRDIKMEALDEEGDEKTGQKRKRYITVVEGGKKRKIVNIGSFHPDLQAAIEKLKVEIAKENWEQKGKFPPVLKPQVAQLALLAIKLDEYDDHFFNLMPVLFPYNKFTMTKLIKRTVFADHIALLQERQEQLVKQLEEQATAGFAKAEEEWQKSVAHWHKRQEKLTLEAANAGNASISASLSAGADGGASGGGSEAPTRHPTEEKDAIEVAEGISTVGGDGAKKEHSTHPPGKKYRLTESMKGIIWDLVLLSNEACRLENEKNGYEGSVIQISEQGGRKVLYQKIVAAFPEGWMSSGQISRDVSAMKKRLEREAADYEG
ncbi:hypothetical protein DFP72DRAFT_820655 [Ephemerocybe angulata]|uniref:Ubinuclein middle domain-containing protein n=1 Tax=Ephemerocybe angulata TaxID=980116 RepID=A0A8H6M1H7_9AGAR|nr:hypothetical protein DFP72DRAFT_820655 [Tulosesus angulatus]